MTDSSFSISEWSYALEQDIARHYDTLRQALKIQIYRDYPHNADQIWNHLAMTLIGIESNHNFVIGAVMDKVKRIVEKYV